MPRKSFFKNVVILGINGDGEGDGGWYAKPIMYQLWKICTMRSILTLTQSKVDQIYKLQDYFFKRLFQMDPTPLFVCIFVTDSYWYDGRCCAQIRNMKPFLTGAKYQSFVPIYFLSRICGCIQNKCDGLVGWQKPFILQFWPAQKVEIDFFIRAAPLRANISQIFCFQFHHQIFAAEFNNCNLAVE